MRHLLCLITAAAAQHCGRRGPFAGGAPQYHRWCAADKPQRLRHSCAPRDAAAQRRWLDDARGGGAAWARYYRSVYGGPMGSIHTDRLQFFWDAAPGRDRVHVQWACYQCPRQGFLPLTSLWAPVEELYHCCLSTAVEE